MRFHDVDQMSQEFVKFRKKWDNGKATKRVIRNFRQKLCEFYGIPYEYLFGKPHSQNTTINEED